MLTRVFEVQKEHWLLFHGLKKSLL